MTDDLTAFIEARLAGVERAARAVEPLGHVIDMGGDRLDEVFVHTRLVPSAIDGRSSSQGDRAAQRHFGYHDPAPVLLGVESTRHLVAAIVAFRHDYNDGDPFYSCSQAADPAEEGAEPGSGCADEYRSGKPCDCGRDAQVRRMLGIVAARWSDHPDYRAGWAP